MNQEGAPTTRRWMRWAMIVVYGAIGLVHLVSTDAFLPIMPDWVPQPRLVVVATGLCELAGAVALMTNRLRRLAGFLFALYAVCVFPANLKHAFDHISVPPIPDSWWYHAPRLALQPVMVWWALYAVHAIDWPFGRGRTGIG
ncbi:DoxX family protein [Methylobacterium sp. C25]|uniref:DoxX family protein n=1 Tax=Methylobacterium sp. C25 TaxID=2721622 RepID=UPI001F29E34B|nr:DoxX family protein [Methylobacterium sp. C25]MCE4224859.1 DoxX family protein [Methylobacterium sp. C25]